MIDFIGDIHGHAGKLKQLLKNMNYTLKNGAYYHPDRNVVFLGDYIDRGPQIKETLDIVRRMVDSGNAIALMGNHEYNAICYNTIGSDGNYLRDPSEEKNRKQHKHTWEQFATQMDLYHEYIQWFYTLPLFYRPVNSGPCMRHGIQCISNHSTTF